LDGPNRVVAVRVNTSLIEWLTLLGLDGSLRTAIYAFVALTSGLTLLFFVFRSNSLMKVVIVSVLASFAVTPYALQYDFPLLTLPLFWAMALFTRSRKALWGGLAFSIFIISVLIWESSMSDGYWMVIGLIGLTAWSWVVAKDESIPEDLLFTKI
jgi:hypothetical protein